MRQFVPLFLFVLLLAACTPQEPIKIIITPTPDTAQVTAVVATSEVLVPSPTMTITPLPDGVVPSVEALPTITPRTPTTVPVEPSPTPDEPPAPQQDTTDADPADPFGAIIDEDYTLPPTSTPRPTLSPTPVNTPITTAMPIPQLDASKIGIQLDHNKDVDTWWQLMIRTQQLGVGWVKFQADWSALQPNGPQDSGAAFRLFRLNVETAKKKGFNVLLSVVKAPAWARSSTEEAGPPDDPQLYANFLVFLLEEIGVQYVDAIEIWNEPNLLREWSGNLPFDGAGYMQLFAPAYGAVKGVAPDIQIVSAGLAPTGNVGGISVNDRSYLQQMYDAGLGNYDDVVIGIHPYSWGNPPDMLCCNAIEGRAWDDDPHFFFLDNVNDYREIMVQNGDADNVMWITELGWATWEGLPEPPPDPWMLYNSAQQQSEYTLRAFQIAEERDDIGLMILWNLNFGNDLLVQNRVERAAYSLFVDQLPIRPLYYDLSIALDPEGIGAPRE